MLGCPAVILNTAAPLPMRLMSVPVLGRGLVKLMTPASPAKAREVPAFLGHPVQVGQHWSEIEAEAYYRFGKAILEYLVSVGGSHVHQTHGAELEIAFRHDQK